MYNDKVIFLYSEVNKIPILSPSDLVQIAQLRTTSSGTLSPRPLHILLMFCDVYGRAFACDLCRAIMRLSSKTLN